MRFSRVVAILAALAGGCGDCSGGGVDASVEAGASRGTISLAWRLTDANGAPISCDDIGAQTVTLALREERAGAGEPAVFSCASLGGTTQPLAAGSYQVDIELTGLGGQLAVLPRQTGVAVEGGRTTDLAPATFAVDARGSLELSLRAIGTTSNCGPVAAMGAGITGVSISLFRAGTCVPAALTIGPGAGRPASTYVINCASPPVAMCIESDQKISAANLPSGAYQVRIRGKLGTTDCWINDDLFQVPPLQRVLARALNLSKLTGSGC